jgi:hypothetical protein
MTLDHFQLIRAFGILQSSGHRAGGAVNVVTTGSLTHFETAFSRVGWFIPPYAPLGLLSELAGRIHQSGYKLSVDDLEDSVAPFYTPARLAAMVCSRYPITPVISEYTEMIAESVEAHFLGLHHVAVAGLVPVIEGAGVELLRQRGHSSKSPADVFFKLADQCKREAKEKKLGTIGEVLSMLDSFYSFAKNVLYQDSRAPEHSDTANQFVDGTNRHGITHGRYRDRDYGRPINFYKVIGAVHFLCFVSAFRANISWLSPASTEPSMQLAWYYVGLAKIGGAAKQSVRGAQIQQSD